MTKMKAYYLMLILFGAQAQAGTWTRPVVASKGGISPTTALNLSIKIKQTPENIIKIEHLKEVFAKNFQPQIDRVFKESGVVHFGRFLIVDNLYILILTEFDGDERFYTEFFRARLINVFRAVFALAENPPTEKQLTEADLFFDYIHPGNLSGLGTDGGTNTSPTDDIGYLFNAYPGVTVSQIQEKFGISLK
jgi:hypothetical protein